MKRTFLIITFTCLLLVLITPNTKGNIYKEDLCYYTNDLNETVEVEDLNSCYNDIKYDRVKIEVKPKKLMIVAHPDDESLWGGAHLLEEEYTVVCITCGVVNYRVTEFEKAMAVTNDTYIMLGYPDLAGPKIDRWETTYNLIYESLKRIIESNNWNVIVTHNPDGEYGHIQHIMTSKIVTDIVSDKTKLYYFDRYYKEGEIPSYLTTINTDTYNKKMNDLLSIYVSQPKAMKRHRYIMNHENFLNFYEW